MNECPSRFTLVRYYTEDISRSELSELQDHVPGCPKCHKNLEEIKTNELSYNDNFQSHAAKLSDALKKEPLPLRRPKSRYAVVAALAAAAAVLLAIFVAPLFLENRQQAQEIAYKGGVSLKVVARRGNSQFNVLDGATLQENDALRFTITSSEPGYLYAVSVDASGQVSVLYPEQGDLFPIDRAGDTTLPGSIVLDDSRGTEHLVVLFAQEPFDRRKVDANITGIAVGNAPASLKNVTIETIRFEKD